MVRNKEEQVRVRDISIEFDRLTVQLGRGVVVTAGTRRRATVTKKPSESKLRKEDILSGAANYIKALMAELEDVKAMMAKDVEVRNKYWAVPNTINFQGGTADTC